ncbi:DUF2071 domain-containing protein [Bremerella sp. JC817]|uniref:YqjF family protein n=1 Tax=Bremerella sp. JC817 TaxID=3231756 RepID=UPI003457707F
MIDRITPTLRPEGPARGFQQWRDLLFLHWPVPVEMLRPLVPSRLEIDCFDGQAYIGVVPFSMLGVRNASWPKWAGMNFLETNVRTYVHYQGRPGVYFLSLDAASRLAVWGARWLWSLPYYHAQMELTRRGDLIEYILQRQRSDGRLKVRYQIGREIGPFDPDSIEFFFLERYLLFLEYRRRIYSGQVHHVPYPAREVSLLESDQSLTSCGGVRIYTTPPSFAHFSPGVDVEIFQLRAISAAG